MKEETLPDGTVAIRVDEPSARYTRPQIYHGPSGDDTVVRYMGRCVGCGKRTYTHDEPNDDNGWLDVSESGPEPQDYGLPDTLPPVRACYLCMNDQDLYNKVLRKAESRWGLARGQLG